MGRVTGKTGSETTGPETTGPEMNGPAKTDSEKTGHAKTGSAKTGSANNGHAKTGSANNSHATTGHAKTGSEQRLRDLARLRRVRDRIDREYARPLDVEALARDAHMSAGHLSRQFRAAYGESPYSYLMTRRIERAMALLRRGDLSVTEVCFAVGCSSLGTFSTRFTELVGVSPSAYRKQAAQAPLDLPTLVIKKVARPVRNREARPDGPELA